MFSRCGQAYLSTETKVLVAELWDYDSVAWFMFRDDLSLLQAAQLS